MQFSSESLAAGAERESHRQTAVPATRIAACLLPVRYNSGRFALLFHVNCFPLPANAITVPCLGLNVRLCLAPRSM